MRQKLRAAIIGPGNIGTDLLRRRAPAMAVALGQRGNAAHGHHASALRVGLSVLLDSVAPLGKDTGHCRRGAPCQGRLVKGADRPTEYDNIMLKED